MTDSKIIIRTGKNIFFKSKIYKVNINGEDFREIDFNKLKTEYNLTAGKHVVQIGNENSFKNKEVILSKGQAVYLTINPSVTYGIGLVFLIGIALVTIILQFFMLDKFSILMTIPLIPIFLMRKRHFSDSFEITVTKQSI